jgi:GNAT superfamily N-acetyltransferase
MAPVATARRWRDSVGEMMRAAVRASRLYVYATPSAGAVQPHLPAGVEFRRLGSADLVELAIAGSDFWMRQIERLERFGESHAYAMVVDGRVAHVSWLLPPAAMRRDEPRLLPIRDAVAEVTGCETLPEFRGRGLYGLAIRSLVAIASVQGIRRVMMKTADWNRASQSGIVKAGLTRVGTAWLITVRGWSKPIAVRLFR